MCARTCYAYESMPYPTNEKTCTKVGFSQHSVFAIQPHSTAARIEGVLFGFILKFAAFESSLSVI